MRRCSTAASPQSRPFSKKAAARLAPAALSEGAADTARLALQAGRVGPAGTK